MFDFIREFFSPTPVIENDLDFYAISGRRIQVVPLEVTLQFRVCLTDQETIKTLEGDTTAHRGDIVLTGLEGEEYTQPVKSFEKKFKDIDWEKGIATKKVDGQTRDVVFPTRKYNAMTWSGIINGVKYEPLIRYGDADFGIIKPHLFDRLYAVVTPSGELCDKLDQESNI